MKKTVVSLFAAGLMAAAVPSAFAATNLLTNGSFETGTPGNAPGAPWSVTGTATIATSSANAGVDFYNAYSPDAPGTQDLTFGGTGAATLSQSLSVTVGQSYIIGYDAAFYGSSGASSGFSSVTINGVTLTNLAISSTTVAGWVEKVAYWTANTTGSVSLVFNESNAGATKLAVDRAFVVTPEPSSMAVLGVSLLGLWRLRRRRAR